MEYIPAQNLLTKEAFSRHQMKEAFFSDRRHSGPSLEHPIKECSNVSRNFRSVLVRTYDARFDDRCVLCQVYGVQRGQLSQHSPPFRRARCASREHRYVLQVGVVDWLVLK